MELDCNLKKLTNFIRFLLCVLEKLLKSDYSLFLLGENISYFPSGAPKGNSCLRSGPYLNI